MNFTRVFSSLYFICLTRVVVFRNSCSPELYTRVIVSRNWKQRTSKPEANGKQTGSKKEEEKMNERCLKDDANKKEKEKEKEVEIENECYISPEAVSLPPFRILNIQNLQQTLCYPL